MRALIVLFVLFSAVMIFTNCVGTERDSRYNPGTDCQNTAIDRYILVTGDNGYYTTWEAWNGCHCFITIEYWRVDSPSVYPDDLYFDAAPMLYTCTGYTQSTNIEGDRYIKKIIFSNGAQGITDPTTGNIITWFMELRKVPSNDSFEPCSARIRIKYRDSEPTGT